MLRTDNKLKEEEISWYINNSTLFLRLADGDLRNEFCHKIGFIIANRISYKGFVEVATRGNATDVCFKYDPSNSSIEFINDDMRQRFVTLLNLAGKTKSINEKKSPSKDELKTATQENRDVIKLLLKDELLKTATQENPVVLPYDKNRIRTDNIIARSKLLKDMFPPDNSDKVNSANSNVESDSKPLTLGLKN